MEEKENLTLAKGDRVVENSTNKIYVVSGISESDPNNFGAPTVKMIPEGGGDEISVGYYETYFGPNNDYSKVADDTSSSDNTSEGTSTNTQSEASTSADTSTSSSATSVSNGEVEDANNHQDVSQIPYDEAIGVVGDFDGLISAFSGIPKVSTNPGFMKLKEAGLEAGFSEKFDGDVEDIISSAQSLSSALRAQIEECKVADLETEKSIPDKRNGSSSGDSSNSTSTNLVDNADKQLDAYENMSMSDLKEVLSTLVSTASACGADLTALINDSKYSDKIKEALLNNVNINKDLKEPG